MNFANLQLSPEELRLVMEPDWILTKNSVMGKVVGLMGGLSGHYREMWETGVSAVGAVPIDPGNVKISRGENYRGLPWVMLDYPRLFGREDVLAIRTFFWWGHSFSVTLHLKGRYLESYLPVIRERWAELAAAGFHVGISGDEWRHEHTPEVFRPMEGDRLANAGADFFKLSGAVGLDRWDEAPELLSGMFGKLAGVLRNISSPAGETGL